ncbi:hypothetical protein CHS0354_025746 [Potamilus streckersoni]|uniref:Cyclic AMP-dependent transcription factor ATF-2 n=1 Tax=Potamilus streckersoni TaxID=2493646 RepID=A0AAE0RUD9_9BIVA|nr:hypothetical protein CHS0354_025746 [Potamilus streckersoni]
MADEDKPFICSQDGCSQRFTNEDHLAVHMKKHDMSLALHLGSSQSPQHLFLDQTPTPTKFLRNCEEMGLFQELTKNPFDDAFKKATESTDDSTSNPLPGPLMLNDLNTPVPGSSSHRSETYFRLHDTDIEGIQTLNRLRENSLSSLREHSLTSIIPKKRKKFMSTHVQPTSTTVDDEQEYMIASTSNGESVIGSSNPKIESINNSIVTSSTTEVESVLASGASSNLTMNTQTAILQQPFSVQVLLQLPNGQTIPVQFPTAALATSTISTNIPNTTQTPAVTASLGDSLHKPTYLTNSMPVHTFAPVTIPASGSIVVSTVSPVMQTQTVPHPVTSKSPAPSPLSGSQSLTKQKLKAAIQQQTTPGSSVKIAQILQMVQDFKKEPQSTVPSPMSDMTVSSPEGSLSDSFPNALTSPKQSKGDEDPEERRRKFLERNRAAAARCRQKRKQWIVNLERKAEELTSTNTRLQGECNQLRTEVAQLKSLLLAHKDCPITLQQQVTQIPQHTTYNLLNDPVPITSLVSGNRVLSSSSGVTPNTVISSVQRVSMATNIGTPSTVTMIPTVVTPNLNIFTKGDDEDNDDDES